MVRKAVVINLTAAPLPGHTRLAGLPLLLRAVLSAQRAGLEEIFIVGGEHPGRLLERDKRVQIRWRWVPLAEAEDAHNEVKALLQVGDQLKENFLLFFADSVFEAKAAASLRAVPLEGKVARIAVGTGGGRSSAAGAPSLYLCRPDFLRLLEKEKEKDAQRIDAVIARYRFVGGPADAVAGRVWERTSDRARLRAIHRELAHFHLKPSDGMFARFNKLVVAERLIRVFLRTPATPNFITGLGLVFALGSGWAFAQGSYWWSIAGAFIAYISAIMDHVDGMVARLKFLESEFGVWFESAVDYASYLFIFVGLAIGLYRETGAAQHLVVGGLFLFGGVVSFVLQSRQRKLASGDDPTDFPNRIHTKLEQHSQNFFHWFSRRAYFLVRRAVLPYFILLFCLLDLRVLLLDWVALGANLVWLLTLYNNRLFRLRGAESRGPAPKAPAAAD